jgi:hypothetical protein
MSGGLEVSAHAWEASNGGSSETPTRWVASDLVFFHVVRLSAWVQQHCSIRSYMSVALSVWWCLPPLLLYRRWFHFRGFDTRISAVVGGRCGCALSPLSSLWAVFGRVDVTIQLVSEYSWAVTRVDVSIQPDEFVLFYFFLFLTMI